MFKERRGKFTLFLLLLLPIIPAKLSFCGRSELLGFFCEVGEEGFIWMCGQEWQYLQASDLREAVCFYKLWFYMKDGDSFWKPVFIPWPNCSVTSGRREVRRKCFVGGAIRRDFIDASIFPKKCRKTKNSKESCNHVTIKVFLLLHLSRKLNFPFISFFLGLLLNFTCVCNHFEWNVSSFLLTTVSKVNGQPRINKSSQNP